jgi:hypothetical protein
MRRGVEASSEVHGVRCPDNGQRRSSVHHGHGVAGLAQDLLDSLPAGAVDETAMDEDDACHDLLVSTWLPCRADAPRGGSHANSSGPAATTSVTQRSAASRGANRRTTPMDLLCAGQTQAVTARPDV